MDQDSGCLKQEHYTDRAMNRYKFSSKQINGQFTLLHLKCELQVVADAVLFFYRIYKDNDLILGPQLQIPE
jgi:hypothetical protein